MKIFYFIKNGDTNEVEVTENNEYGLPYNILEAETIEDAKVEAEKIYLRDDRIYLLEAFDRWEKAVLRNREQDSTEIMDWYNDILDLKKDAFKNIPDRIKYYLN